MKYYRLYQLLMEHSGWIDTVKSGGDIIEVFKNPSISEIQQSSDRGIVDKNGNLYMISNTTVGNNDIIHSNIFDILFKLKDVNIKSSDEFKFYGFNKEPVMGATVQRKPNDPKTFYLGESMFWEAEDTNPDKIKKVAQIMKKAKSKNPSLNFPMEGIDGDKFDVD